MLIIGLGLAFMRFVTNNWQNLKGCVSLLSRSFDTSVEGAFTFQESGDNTVDVEFVRLSHLPALPEDLVLHEVPLLSDWVLIHKQSLSVELELSLLCDLS